MLGLLADLLLIGPLTSPGMTCVILALPFALIAVGLRDAVRFLARNDLIRVVFPPLC